MKKYASVICAVAILFVLSAGALQAQTTSRWVGADAEWKSPDSDSFSPSYTNGYTVLFDGSGPTTINVYTGGVAPAAIIVTNSVNYTFSSPIIGINGPATLTKGGSSTVTFGGNNSFTGDITISGGTLSFSSVVAWGGSGRNVAFTGSATINTADGYTGGQISVDTGFTASAYNSLTFTSASGWGSIIFGMADRKTLTLGDASTFHGTLRLNGGGAGGAGSSAIQFTALGDASGAGNIQFAGGSGDAGQSASIRLQNNAGPLTLNNRRIEFIPKPNNWSFQTAILENNNGSAANTWVIKTSLLNNQDRDHNFQLGGSNTGSNQFAGVIGNSTRGTYYAGSGLLSLIKADGGTWILSGTNTYTGGTTINAGKLEIGGAGCLGSGLYNGPIVNNATFSCNTTADQIFGYAISGTGTLIKDNTGKLTLNFDSAYSGAMTIRGGALLGLSSGSCSNSAVTVTNTPGITAAFGVVVNDNTYQFSVAGLTFKTNDAGAQLQFTFSVEPSTNIAPLNILGDLTFNGAPLVVVNGNLKPGTNPFPLLTVGGLRPVEVPDMTAPSFTGKLYWGGTGNKTLFLLVSGRGTVLILK